MIRRTVFLLRSVTGFALLAAFAWTQDLPPGQGRAETERLCKQCHELARVTSLRQDHDAWNQTMAKMKAYGMKASDHDYALVLDYLANAFPAEEIPKVN